MGLEFSLATVVSYAYLRCIMEGLQGGCQTQKAKHVHDPRRQLHNEDSHKHRLRFLLELVLLSLEAAVALVLRCEELVTSRERRVRGGRLRAGCLLGFLALWMRRA